MHSEWPDFASSHMPCGATWSTELAPEGIESSVGRRMNTWFPALGLWKYRQKYRRIHLRVTYARKSTSNELAESRHVVQAFDPLRNQGANPVPSSAAVIADRAAFGALLAAHHGIAGGAGGRYVGAADSGALMLLACAAEPSSSSLRKTQGKIPRSCPSLNMN